MVSDKTYSHNSILTSSIVSCTNNIKTKYVTTTVLQLYHAGTNSTKVTTQGGGLLPTVAITTMFRNLDHTTWIGADLLDPHFLHFHDLNEPHIITNAKYYANIFNLIFPDILGPYLDILLKTDNHNMAKYPSPRTHLSVRGTL